MSIERLLSTSLLALAAAGGAFAAPLGMGQPLGVSWGPLYGFPPRGAETFVPQARAIGASFSRITLYWSQLEPRPGGRRWDELDAYLAQLSNPEEGLLTLSSVSRWATRVPSDVFPSSPAKNADDYYAFVRAVVEHVGGRIRYFQSDQEPNNPFFWQGSAADYVEHQKTFYRAVKDADPQAIVVLGGCDGLFDPTGVHPLPGQAADLAFFSAVIADAATAYDVFDLRLYGDPYTIPDRVRFIRDAIARAGSPKPIIATEYNGPGFFEFAGNRRWASTLMNPATAGDALKRLAATTDALPIETRMFLPTASAADAARLQSLAADDLVIRNVLALASGVQRTAYFDLWHERGAAPPTNELLFGSFRLLDRVDGRLVGGTPLATAFAHLVEFLAGADAIEREIDDAHPDVFLFRVSGPGRSPGWIAWRRPAKPGDETAPVTIAAPGSDRTDGISVGASPVSSDAESPSSLLDRFRFHRDVHRPGR